MEYPEAGSDPAKDPFEGIDDPTLRVQMQHEMYAIEELVFVTKLSFVSVHKDTEEGFRSTLSYYFLRGHDNCGKGQDQTLELSRKRTPLLSCLKELWNRLQDRRDFRWVQTVVKKAAADADSATTVSPNTPNVLQTMVQLEQVKTRAKTANKVDLDSEKEQDDDEQKVQRLQQVIQVKITRTHDTTGNDHEECDKKSSDDWDLGDYRR